MPEESRELSNPTPSTGLTPSGGAMFQPQVATPADIVPGVEKFMVVLGRPGVGVNKFMVPPGTTVRKLLEEAGANANNQDIMKNNEKLTLDYVLQPRDVLFLIPKPKNADSPDRQEWREWAQD